MILFSVKTILSIKETLQVTQIILKFNKLNTKTSKGKVLSFFNQLDETVISESRTSLIEAKNSLFGELENMKYIVTRFVKYSFV